MLLPQPVTHRLEVHPKFPNVSKRAIFLSMNLASRRGGAHPERAVSPLRRAGLSAAYSRFSISALEFMLK